MTVEMKIDEVLHEAFCAALILTGSIEVASTRRPADLKVSLS
jgi:hypothetical protein